jgi:hypothetical protein
MRVSPPLRRISRKVNSVPLSTMRFRQFTYASPPTPSLAVEDSEVLLWSGRRISWKTIFKTPSMWLIRWNPRIAFRFRSLWMLLFWWSFSVPRAAATITAATTAPVHFTMEPRESFAHPPKYAETESTNPSPEGSSMTARQQCIRSRTGSAVVFGTALLAAARVKRNRRARIPTEDRNTIDYDADTANQDPLSRRQDLQWLFPQNAPPTNDQEQPAMKEAEATVVVDKPPTPQLLSSTNNIIANAKAIASQKLQSNWMKNRHGFGSPIGSSGHPHPMTAALPRHHKKALYRQQQPKSPVEEARLQAKYAAIESLEERAFTILVDLGMVEWSSPDSLENVWQ